MSLTSIMKGGFSKIVTANIPIPRDKFKPSQNCVACPKTKNFSLMGTAFDYLLRSELKRVHPESMETEFVAEASMAKVQGHIMAEGYYQAKNQRIGEKELFSMVSVAKKYREARAAFIADGILKNSFLETTIKFARMDVIFRAGFYDDIDRNVDPLDIEDMRALYNLTPNEFKNSATNILLDPNFGEVSGIVGGADVDLIMDNTMIDIKTTKEMKLDEYLWSQLVGYLMLADEAHHRDRSFPKIENIGLYFSRYGYLWKIGADYVRDNPNYDQVKNNLLEGNINS